MECDKNPFLEMTQDQIKKLDEVLQSEQAKALLEEAAKKLIDSRSAMDDHATIHSMESIGSLSDFDTLDLQSSSRSGIFTDYEDAVSMASDMLHGQLSLAELIFLEHSYAIKPTPLAENISENPTETVTEVSKSVPNASLSTSRSPIRRSLRVIEKVERKQTEKVKIQSEESPKKGGNQSFEERNQNGDRRMSFEITENITQFSDKKPQSHIVSSANNLHIVQSDEDSESLTNQNINSLLKSGGREKKRTSNEIPLRERKSKRLGLVPSDKTDTDTKSSHVTKELCSPPGKKVKSKLSPKKRGSLSAISNTKKQSPKFKEKNISFVSEKIDDEIDMKTTRKRNSSAVIERSKVNRNRQSVDNISRAKRKKSLSLNEEDAKISSKKESTENDNKDIPEQDPQPLPSPSVQKPKPVKKIKRDSVTLSLGFEPALFSQPDVMVKIKSDESPNKKLDKENEEMSSKAIDSLLEPLSQREMNQLMEETLTPSLEKTESSNEEELIKDTKNNSSDLSNVAIEKDLPMFKDMPLTNDVFNNSESELSQCSNQNLSSLSNADDLQENVEDISPPLSANNEITLIPHARKVSQQSVKRDSLPECKISQDSNPKIEDDKSKISRNDTSSNKSDADVKEETGPTPERKSRRIIKRKEFFEEVSFQETKRTLKKNAQASNVKKPFGEQSKKSIENDKLKKDNEKDCAVVTDDSENDDDDDDDDELDSDWSSEDDPEKLWCICRKPHNHRFMIQCDSCEDWFHGSCVGVTRQQGQQLEKLKKEWKCPNCIKVGPLTNASLSSHSTSKSISNEKKEVQKRSLKKEDQDAMKRKLTTPGDVGTRKMQKTTPSVLQKQLTADAGAKRKNGEFVPNTNATPPIKQMTKGRDEFVNRNIRIGVRKAHADKNQNEKISVITKAFTPQKTLSPQKTPVSAKKSTPPSKKNDTHPNVRTRGTPVVKEKVTKDVKKKNGCVSCDKVATPGSCYCSNACIEKHANECLKLIRESKSSSKVVDSNLQRLVVFDRLRGTVIAGDNGPTASEIIPWLKSNPNFMIACTSSEDNKTENSEERTSDRRDDDETAKETVRLNVRKTLKNILEERCKNADDLNIPEEDVRKISLRIEEELHLLFRDNSFKYRAKYRSLMFNIKDPRNQGLFRKILQGKIPPDRLVKMSTDELASVQLAKWREQENQHCLDMIKRVQLEQLKTGGGLLIKKTHKGEVEIEDEATGVIEQDVPKPSLKIEDEIPEAEKVDLTEMAKDTTHLHRSHLFDLNCKVCTGKMAPPPAEEVMAKKVRVAHSISVDFSSPSTMDSVEKSVSRVVDGKSPLSSTGDDSVDHSTISNESKKPQNIKKNSTPSKSKKKEKSSKGSSSVWKGFIFMQDVAKFVTSAYKVSGHTEHLHQDIPDSVQVCGRIKPDQVWDYLSKIKQSGNKELIIIRFQAANDEESATYNSFYNYLNSRKRYGVVNNSSKKIKDFYILPLPATSPVPIVLMPFEGPGLPSHRPHLLLGVIVRHKIKQAVTTSSKKQVVKEAAEVVETIEGSFTPPLDTRSYTPPLPSTEPEEKIDSPAIDLKKKVSEENNVDPYIPGISTKRINEEIEFYEPSYTPPLETMPKSDLVVGKEDDKPYDPEQDISHLLLTDQEETKSTSREGNNNIPLSSPVNLEKHKKILDELTRQCEETDRQVAALQQFIAAPVNPDVGIQPPFSQALDIAQVSATGMSSFLDLPKNLQDILNVVRQKTFEQDQITKDTGDVDMRSSTNLPGNIGFRDVDIRPKFKDDSEDRTSSQGATPPLDEEPESSLDPRPSDPRIKLRTNFQDGEESTAVPLSSLSASELVERAEKELAEMEAVEQVNQLSQVKSGSSKRLKSGDWTQYKEPPPPGIEPSDIHTSESIFTPKLPQSPLPPLPPTYASTSEAQLGPHFPPTLIPPPPFQAHLPPPSLFPMQLPPHNGKNCMLPPAVVPTGYLPPLPPSPHLKKDMSSHPQEDGWGAWQLPPGQPGDGEWEEGPARWNEDDWNHTTEGYPPDYYPEDGDPRYYPSEPSGDYYDEPSESRTWGRPSQRHDREGGWYKRFDRNDRRENRWRGRRRPFSRGRGNNNRN